MRTTESWMADRPVRTREGDGLAHGTDGFRRTLLRKTRLPRQDDENAEQKDGDYLGRQRQSR